MAIWGFTWCRTSIRLYLSLQCELVSYGGSTTYCFLCCTSCEVISLLWHLFTIFSVHYARFAIRTYKLLYTVFFGFYRSADDGTCRLWDARYSQFKPRIYLPRSPDSAAGLYLFIYVVDIYNLLEWCLTEAGKLCRKEHHRFFYCWGTESSDLLLCIQCQRHCLCHRELR